MQILALPLISIIFKNKLGSFETDCRCQQCLRKLTQAVDYENNLYTRKLRIDKINPDFIEN